MDNEFMKIHSIKEVSKLIEVAEGTIRQWEKDFEGVLVIPRDQNNSRYYTDFEIETLTHIKKMREKDIPKKMIKELMESKPKSEQLIVPQPSVSSLKQSEVVQTLKSIQNSLDTFPELRQMIVTEIKNDIRDEIKIEMNKLIQTGNNETSEQLKTLSETLNNQSSEQFKEISESFKKMESNYKSELEKRDRVSMENMRLLSELKEVKNELLQQKEKNKSWFSFFKKS